MKGKLFKLLSMQISLYHKNHIILDQMETWPDSIKKYLTVNEEKLKAYVLQEQSLDKQAEANAILRYHRPKNNYQISWNSAIEMIKQQIEGYSIIGFHCTRLTESEILDIKINGLHPLDPSFTEYRIINLLKQNLISSFTANAIRTLNESSAYSRKDNVCFFHCLSTLQDEWGLYRLFCFWGGEAVYIWERCMTATLWANIIR